MTIKRFIFSRIYLNRNIYILVSIYYVYMAKKEIIVKDFEEVLERDITSFGNGSHVILPQKHKNKKAIIIIKK